MLKEFNIQDIGELDDGRVAAQVNKAMRRCVEDMMNRPGASAARSVTIKMSMRPIIDEDGVCTDFTVECESCPKLPTHKSKTFTMRANPSTKTGLFNAASPNQPRQTTLDEVKN